MMRYDFNADEILQMAEKIEKNGADFYRECAGNVADPAAVELLEKLAAMEDDHEKTFANIRSQLSAREKENTTFEISDTKPPNTTGRSCSAARCTSTASRSR